ncbi:hypothetical protein [Glycomyces harbinensis]|uniref:SMI1/KNR4 family protein n=1 Tax=Glycomyces harbinensis TaxID=58114 RepID=A0A1G7B0R0_9ACTN|nr:hypothetical protein [Glycomyces harbinensis]SDE20704.1 hypothetical protein SAMN05216270_11570 [Glycomyces harbinensis]
MARNAGARLGRRAARLLVETGECPVLPGLTDDELADVESEFGFEFGDDHRAFLAAGLPLGALGEEGHWPNWRYGDPDALRARLAWPVNGVLFDVEQGTFWYDAWGPRPTETEAAVAEAREHLARVPVMVPIYSHRYLPAGRENWGHPILSMYQTDIIVYGADLVDYVENEFGRTRHHLTGDPQATVEFWKDLVG